MQPPAETLPTPNGRRTPGAERIGIVMLMGRFYPYIGGYQTQSLRLGQALLEKRIDLCVVTARRQKLAPFEVHKRIPIHRVAAFGKGRLSAICYFVSSLVWMVRNRKLFQIIQANRIFSGLIAGLGGLLLRKQVVCRPTRGEEIHALGVGLLGRLRLHWLRRTVHRFVAITPGIESDLRTLGIPPNEIVRIENGITLDAGRHDPASVRAGLGWDEGMTVVTFVGRLVPEKGVDWLLDVWAQVVAECDRARLLVVGDGRERQALEARAESLGISRTVMFAGNQPEVFPFLAASDVFVLPSRLEGSSNALLEAMSQGLPVIVADDVLGGNRQLVENGTEGYVVPLEDTVALRRGILELLRDPSLRTTMGTSARRRVEQNRSMDRVAERYYEVYQALADRAG